MARAGWHAVPGTAWARLEMPLFLLPETREACLDTSAAPELFSESRQSRERRLRGRLLFPNSVTTSFDPLPRPPRTVQPPRNSSVTLDPTKRPAEADSRSSSSTDVCCSQTLLLLFSSLYPHPSRLAHPAASVSALRWPKSGTGGDSNIIRAPALPALEPQRKPLLQHPPVILHAFPTTVPPK